jgi:hypothetical protein
MQAEVYRMQVEVVLMQPEVYRMQAIIFVNQPGGYCMQPGASKFEAAEQVILIVLLLV